MSSTLMPALRYADAPAAIDWFCRNLGFERHAVFANPDGSIAHAELTFERTGMLMLGSAKGDLPLPSSQISPDTPNLPSYYLVTPRTAQLFDQCTADGAHILMSLRTMDYGGLAFGVRDPEGYHWSIGEYNPWAPSTAPASQP